ncbi:hypothetical protein [Patulibacter sp. SYSU D01012]|uniref:hypothetical protein n=1 Tax=Patulibacter sp. SYSU D01012 TaxID=2817381 RepID=UPI001B30D108|nr:hypothetical protein [Patulibacter sp. SYSU D01012]
MGDEAELTELAAAVTQARAAIYERAKSEPDRWWSPRELSDPEIAERATPTVLMIALGRLVAERQLDSDSRHRVRVSSQHA